jgi:FAS-associated factor 2
MADNGMDRQKLAYFQEITGVKDSSLAHQILDAYGWDLDAAVQAMVDKDTNEIPEYQESMQVVAGGSSSETILTSPSTLLGNAIVESTTTSINDNDHADERSIFERIGDGGNLYGPTGGMEEDPNAANVVWRVVTLPFVLLRGSYKLIFGAVGLGVWVAGGVLNAGLGMCTIYLVLNYFQQV